MLPAVQQQAAGTLARQIRNAAPRFARTANWQQLQRYGGTNSAQAAISSPLLATSINAVPGVLNEQGQLPHVSVLLREVLDNLNHMPIKVYVDCTLGAGGHMSAMIQQHPELVAAAGIDVDPTAHDIATGRLEALTQQLGRRPTIHQLKGNYRYPRMFPSQVCHRLLVRVVYSRKYLNGRKATYTSGEGQINKGVLECCCL
eukprot:GHUV01037322.1.p1 GENE.GHUV01037322.1~~GHUV01037322.1.p1  ORF type:complete len:201 (+),score=25.92 GHUV01037322.1:218-820(+)